MTVLGLIRHAATPWNREKRLQGRTDLDLCPEGVQDARSWARVLAPMAFGRVVCSPLVRARHTAEILAGVLDAGLPVVMAGLTEQHFGQWEGRRLSEIRQEEPGEVEAREAMGWLFQPPGGESREAVLKRSLKALEQAALVLPDHGSMGDSAKVYGTGGARILVVTHASVIKAVIYHLLGRSLVRPGSRVLKSGHVHLVSWNPEAGLLLDQVNAADLAANPMEDP
ncbi:MAG: histidine phosphatase family protein [Pseudomonadota bacterium]